VVGDLNLSGSRFIYGRNPLLAGYDLTKLGYPASYNNVSGTIRTPPTPAFLLGDIGRRRAIARLGITTRSQRFALLDNHQGQTSIQRRRAMELGLDSYFQTNIASGAFGFLVAGRRIWPAIPARTLALLCRLPSSLAQGGPASFVNQTEGRLRFPRDAGRQNYRVLWYGYLALQSQLTLNLGLRYELPGTWSERFNRLPMGSGCDQSHGDGLRWPRQVSLCFRNAVLVGDGRNTPVTIFPAEERILAPAGICL